MSKPHETIGKLLAALALLDEDELRMVHNIDRADATPSTVDEAVFAWIDAGRPVLPDVRVVLAEWREDGDGRLFRSEQCRAIGSEVTVWNVAGVWVAVYWPTGGLGGEEIGRFESRGKAKAAVDARLTAEGFVLEGGAAC